MNSPVITISQESRAHDQAFNASFIAVKALKSRHVKLRPHRSFTTMKVTPWLLTQAIGLPIVLCALLWLTRADILDFWRACITFWASGLGLPFERVDDFTNVLGPMTALAYGPPNTPLPSPTTMLVTALVTFAGLALSILLKGALLPLKYPLRIACVVQAAALVYFWLNPNSFPYSIARHSEELITIGYVVMLATPIMLALGYYILNERFSTKLAYTALILIFFLIMVPHQVLMQALILQHLSVLFMPVLYICFGAVFDALVFVALYSWAASNTPERATL